ncbi:MAG: hypothetical protein KKF89_01980 [Nanoarchaeota archaeon]|nr:hypothetical protein [Nanoarchaeota archaeon]
MNIEISCDGSLDNFGDIKSNVEDMENVDSVEVRQISKLSVDAGTGTTIAIGVVSVGLQLAKIIYDIVQDRKKENKTVNIKVNQQIVNINTTDTIEQLQLKLNIYNKK